MGAAFKCRLCAVCDGRACAGELPGMGGVFGGKNSILNCQGWKKIFSSLAEEKIQEAAARFSAKKIRLAPMTGAEENVGWPDEESFYAPFYAFAASLGIGLCVGDGCPDSKLLAGIAAVRALDKTAALQDNGAEGIGQVRNGIQERGTGGGNFFQDKKGGEEQKFSGGQRNAAKKNVLQDRDFAARFGLENGVGAARKNFAPKKAAVFLKPYPQETLFERLEWAAPVAHIVGVDIDAYNIVTMRQKVHLEKKTAAQLNELRRAAKLPLAVKGVWTKESLSLIEELRPDVAVISNHGGRVETDIGSTAEFLEANYARVKNCCGSVWVDGGVRSKDDALAALALGAEEVLLGRPIVSAFLRTALNAARAL